MGFKIVKYDVGDKTPKASADVIRSAAAGHGEPHRDWGRKYPRTEPPTSNLAFTTL